MTGNDEPTRGGLPAGPPWPLDLLADLQAGLLEAADADELRRRVESDPDARQTLAALEATRHSLAALPAPRMPADVAARIDAAIAREAAARAAGPVLTATPGLTAIPGRPDSTRPADFAGQPIPGQPNFAGQPGSAGGPPAQVVDLAAARTRRRRGLVAGAGILTAAAAAVAVFAIGNLGGTTGGEPIAGPTPSDSAVADPLALTSDNLDAALDDTLGATDYGPLASANRLDGCLQANGVTGVEPVGARQVTFDGRSGVLLVVPAGSNPPRWRMLVVGPTCGPDEPATLADTTTG